MPIFGLVWMASWVSCFFPSSHCLLDTVSALPQELLTPNTQTRLASLTRAQSGMPTGQRSVVSASRPQRPTLQRLVAKVERVLSENTLRSAIAPAIHPPQPDHKRDRSPSVTLGFGRCTLVEGRADGSVHPQAKVFRIRINNHLIGATLNQRRANQIVQRLEELLQQPDLDPFQIQPVMVNGLPAGQVGDRLLFVIDPAVAQDWTCNPELLAIIWVNNLRVALAVPPLPLATAQENLHQLQATEKKIAGLASWYGSYFHGQATATGEAFNQNDFTAAHPSLPFDTYLKVTNLKNGKSVVVRINDRGPYFKNRSLDLSNAAAQSLDSEHVGVIPVEAVVMKPTKSGSVPANPTSAKPKRLTTL